MSDFSRRNFLKEAGGAVFAAGMSSKTVKNLIPLVIPDERFIPGVWNYIATTCRECPAGCGMHLWHRDGRVTKAEGNPLHPVNRGALCPRGQSSVQGLYDPARLKKVVRRTPSGEETVSWPAAIEEIGKRLAGDEGRVAIISSLHHGAQSELLQAFSSAFGMDRVAFYEPFGFEPLRAAHGTVFGLPLIPHYRLDTCRFILSFGADFLETWISPVEFGRGFAASHAYGSPVAGRFAYVGPRYSMTAANADLFVQCPAGGEFLVAMAVLNAIVKSGLARADVSALMPVLAEFQDKGAAKVPASLETVQSLARAFASSSESIALACPTGDSGLAFATSCAAALLNYAAGNIGRTVDFSRPHAFSYLTTGSQQARFLASLSREDVLIINDANIVYSNPASASQIRNAGTVVYMGLMPDETAAVADWVLPADYPLEMWDVYEPQKGLHSFLQPTMPRLYDTLSAGDILLGISQAAKRQVAQPETGQTASDYEGWVRGYWERLAARLANGKPSGEFWTETFRAGFLRENVPPAVVHPQGDVQGLNLTPAYNSLSEPALSLWTWANIMLYDGRSANRGWMQEAPEPVSYIVWNNWADIHPATAARLGIVDGNLIDLSTDAGSVRLASRVTTDVAEGTIALSYGQGHTALGANAAGRGANTFIIAPPSMNAQLSAAKASAMETQAMLVNAAASQRQYGREILLWQDDEKPPEAGHGEEIIMPLPEGYEPSRDLYPPHFYRDHRWAMVIDLDRCIGCGACAVACYAENNIPVVGETDMYEGREMAWLKVVPYRKEGGSRVGFLPILCQHCDAAPCEPVCPVFASVHNEHGLNAQVYNRCIGTRYCSNNCPYKVRRFGWRNTIWTHPLNLQLNPEVTVRSRGVMEKCTFCIQRIHHALYEAFREGRPLNDGAVTPACAQTCPTDTIVFGDLMNNESRVSKLIRNDPRRYQVLRELNTKPAVIYLKRVVRKIQRVWTQSL